MNEPQPDFSNKAYLLPHINREGWRFGLIALVLPLAALIGAILLWRLSFAGAFALGLLILPLALLAYGVFLFFRDPVRYPPSDETALLSPADGRICLIQEVPLPNELLDAPDPQTYWRVSVFMSVFNVHVNRMPLKARIVKKAYVPGKFFNASLDKASKDNERCAYLMETPAGTRFGVVQIAGLVAKRIVPFVKEGDALDRAARFGLIRFGSRLDVYLPKGIRPEVRVGQIMVAGETVLAHATV